MLSENSSEHSLDPRDVLFLWRCCQKIRVNSSRKKYSSHKRMSFIIRDTTGTVYVNGSNRNGELGFGPPGESETEAGFFPLPNQEYAVQKILRVNDTSFLITVDNRLMYSSRDTNGSFRFFERLDENGDDILIKDVCVIPGSRLDGILTYFYVMLDVNGDLWTFSDQGPRGVRIPGLPKIKKFQNFSIFGTRQIPRFAYFIDQDDELTYASFGEIRNEDGTFSLVVTSSEKVNMDQVKDLTHAGPSYAFITFDGKLFLMNEDHGDGVIMCRGIPRVVQVVACTSTIFIRDEHDDIWYIENYRPDLHYVPDLKPVPIYNPGNEGIVYMTQKEYTLFVLTDKASIRSVDVGAGPPPNQGLPIADSTAVFQRVLQIDEHYPFNEVQIVLDEDEPVRAIRSKSARW